MHDLFGVPCCFPWSDYSMAANAASAFRIGADDPLLLDEQDLLSIIPYSGIHDNHLDSKISSALEPSSGFVVEDDYTIDMSDYLRSPSPTFHTGPSSPSQRI